LPPDAAEMHPTGSEVYREKESPTLQGPGMRRSTCPAFRVRFWGCPPGCEPEQPEEPEEPEEPEREERAALPPWPGLVRPVRPAQALT